MYLNPKIYSFTKRNFIHKKIISSGILRENSFDLPEKLFDFFFIEK